MAISMFLKLDLINGDSTRKGFEKQLAVESFSWGESRDDPNPAQANELAIVAAHGQAGPQLALHCLQGTDIGGGVLSILATNPSGAESVHTTFALTHATVASYQLAGVAGDVTASDAFTLTFQQITFTSNGSPAGPAVLNFYKP